MNPANATTDLTLLHQRILADFGAFFGTPWKIAFYLRQPDRLNVPCIGLELTDFSPTSGDGGNIGTDQFQANLRFESFVFTDYKMPDYRVKTRLYGAQLSAFLLGRQWSGVANGPCRVLGGGEDRWQDQGAAQYDCWRVEWEQSCLFNTDIYSGGTIPSEIYLGFTPNVGPAHVDDYTRIA